jgi:hypothetical protein
MSNLPLTNNELQKLKDATSVSAWNQACDDIKEIRLGNYPSDWFQKVIQSGLISSKGF